MVAEEGTETISPRHWSFMSEQISPEEISKQDARFCETCLNQTFLETAPFHWFSPWRFKSLCIPPWMKRAMQRSRDPPVGYKSRAPWKILWSFFLQFQLQYLRSALSINDIFQLEEVLATVGSSIAILKSPLTLFSCSWSRFWHANPELYLVVRIQLNLSHERETRGSAMGWNRACTWHCSRRSYLGIWKRASAIYQSSGWPKQGCLRDRRLSSDSLSGRFFTKPCMHCFFNSHAENRPQNFLRTCPWRKADVSCGTFHALFWQLQAIYSMHSRGYFALFLGIEYNWGWSAS